MAHALRSHCCTPDRGYLRRLGMREPRQQVQFVLRRQGQTHPGQHRVGATAVQPPDVRSSQSRIQTRNHSWPVLPYQ